MDLICSSTKDPGRALTTRNAANACGEHKYGNTGGDPEIIEAEQYSVRPNIAQWILRRNAIALIA